jgi:cobalamin biosynthesis protein CobD/CbiB
MSLIIIIFSLISERFLGDLKQHRRYDWFHTYVSWVFNHSKDSAPLGGLFGVLLILASLVVPVAILFAELYEYSLLLWFAFSLAALIFTLGPKTFYEDVKSFCTAMETDKTDSALWYAEDLLDRKLTSEEKSNLTRSVMEGLYIASNERLFGALLWFIALGPAGALLFRLSSELGRWGNRCNLNEKDCRFANAAARVHQWLNFVPARVLSLSFSLCGNAIKGISFCRTLDESTTSRWSRRNEQVIICSALGAMSVSEDDLQNHPENAVAAALQLIRRTILLWVGIAALLTLMGLLK